MVRHLEVLPLEVLPLEVLLRRELPEVPLVPLALPEALLPLAHLVDPAVHRPEEWAVRVVVDPLAGALLLGGHPLEAAHQ